MTSRRMIIILILLLVGGGICCGIKNKKIKQHDNLERVVPVEAEIADVYGNAKAIVTIIFFKNLIAYLTHLIFWTYKHYLFISKPIFIPFIRI